MHDLNQKMYLCGWKMEVHGSFQWPSQVQEHLSYLKTKVIFCMGEILLLLLKNCHNYEQPLHLHFSGHAILTAMKYGFYYEIEY